MPTVEHATERLAGIRDGLMLALHILASVRATYGPLSQAAAVQAEHEIQQQIAELDRGL